MNVFTDLFVYFDAKANYYMEEIKNEEIDKSKEAVKQDAKGLFQSIKTFMNELLDFRHDTDQEATIEAIKNDIPFKGATAWILICSIFVASIGLNANSTAVVIGAMLISPLMGPILGVGMSLAINDIDTLRKSLINLATMIVLSLLTAFLFFFLFPLREATSELLGRVQPDIRDVLIAFFGGLALIIARTKKGTIASVIFGVAIATALMPPLCTAGYGLAIGKIDYFLGAMYLFTINAIFIALATFIVLKLLGFTMIRYVNSKKRKRTAQIASVVALLVMVPAVKTFINVYKDTVIEADYKRFLADEVEINQDLWLLRKRKDNKEKKILLRFNGEVPEAVETNLKAKVKLYKRISDFNVEVLGNKSRSIDDISESLERAYNNLDQKDYVINGLQKEIEDLKSQISSLNITIEKADKNIIPFSSIARDAKIRFSQIEEIRFSKMLSTKDFIKIDTLPQLSVLFNKKYVEDLKESSLLKKEEEIRKWLQKEMKLDTLYLKK
ncbi:putative hydrophobic protein (TIGR00271 family) [Tenacibaculum skagerrakense]|uniref:Putative hydrophobic protein (TIGR00271 family) n=1 Tax=Tenacibaculum skagerrakense TaxID=186571 RepID=A0A4R2NZC7_9FLAO|nr:DUF389 domain-containing protein [Tenacibaculum skagerrakense]TCP26755.1 putative hydrophobic protein (TIGR00271 family) [Tenacibaculum skagerrakense]